MQHTVIRAACAALFLAAAIPAVADDFSGRFTVIEENDLFASDNHDQHYTQGVRLSYLSPSLEAGHWLAPPRFWGLFPDGQKVSRHFNISVGQEMFTPRDKQLANPDPRDRPYAGYLHLGFGWLQDTDQRQLDHLGVTLGIVGPAAQGAQAQNRFHLAIDVPSAQGWRAQLHDEVAGTVDYHRLWRITLAGTHHGIDLIPQAGITVGNIYDYVETGARLRIGRNLRADYGPSRIAPGPSGTDYFNGDYLDPEDPWTAYVYIGAQGRAVGRNVFLDGNSFESSRSVSKNVLVGDLEVGFVVGLADWFRVSYSFLVRGREFKGQRGDDKYGSLTASIVLPF